MKCSVLLPVYNGGPPLREAIDSILAQDEADFELLIIDDGSTDDSPAVIASYAGRDRRIRVMVHPRNAGLAATLNEGLREARAPLVARMDGDDAALPQRLSTQIRFLATRPRVAVAGSFVYHMGRTPERDRLVQLPVEHREIVETLPKSNCLYHPSVMLRREAILELGGYRSDFHNSEDYDLWLRASRRTELANIPVPLLRYRFSAAGMSFGKKWEQVLYAHMAVLSYQNPEWSLERVRASASEELARRDKDGFLLGVARGTVEELTRLGMTEDARRVWWQFFRQLGWRRKLQLAMTSGLLPFRP